jgi:threonine synthase
MPEAITKAETVAEGISSATPLRGAEVLEAVKRSRGSIVAVDEKPIVDGIFALASRGIYVEPTSAVVVPGISKLMESGAISKGETTVVFLSGSGLKATDKILELRRKIK